MLKLADNVDHEPWTCCYRERMPRCSKAKVSWQTV